ncbi:hypothetical protein [Lactovum odontotermitis]
MLRISQIKISISDPISKVKTQVLKKLRIPESDLLDYRIYKESIDAEDRIVNVMDLLPTQSDYAKLFL